MHVVVVLIDRSWNWRARMRGGRNGVYLLGCSWLDAWGAIIIRDLLGRGAIREGH